MQVTIKGAQIIAPGSSHHNTVTNVIIEQGRIKAIGKKEEGKVIEAKGMLLTPGWFDMRANFNDPGYEHKEDLESGLNAAAAGGFTGVALLPNTNPVIDTKNDVKYLQSRNEGSLVQVYPYGAVTKGCLGEELTEMIDISSAGAVAFTDGQVPVWHTDILLKTLQYLQPYDKLLINKAEEKWLNMFGQMHEGKASTYLGLKGMPALGEELMVSRDLDILRYTGGKLHFSVISTAGAIELIGKAKKEGLNISCDMACYQPLLSDNLLMDYDTNLKVNPPLRDKATNKKLIKALKDGVIDVLVSNHLPQDAESKNLEFDLADFGIISLQTFGANLVELSSSVGWEQLIEKVAVNPRKLLDITVPVIEEQAHAELTLFDPDRVWTPDRSTSKSKSENSPWYGKPVTGKVKAVFNNGKHWIDL